MEKYIIPACHHYIVNKTYETDYNQVVSVSFSAYRNRHGSGPDMNDVLFAYHSIGVSLKEESLSIVETSCYEIISRFQCSFMCATCPYSNKYRNMMEHDETTIISYAMQSADHFNYIHQLGCNSQLFKSVLFMGKESTVPIIPLLSLIYDFMKNVAYKTGYEDIHTKLIRTLKETNKDKLNEKSYEFLENYIQNMYATGKKFQKKDMAAPLQKLGVRIPTEVAKKPNDTTTCLVGLLPDPVPSKINEHQSKNPTKPQTDVPAVPTPIHKPVIKKKQATIAHEKTSTLDSNVVLTDTISETELEKQVNERGAQNSRLENSFTPTGEEYIDLRNPSVDIDDFKRLLLLTPYIPFEILKNKKDNKQYFLLYLSRHFYYFPLASHRLFLLIKAYACKNKYRKLLCLNANLLTYWMHKHDHHVNNICSLHFIINMLLISNGKKLIHDPIGMIKKYENITSSQSLYLYPDIMPLYNQIFKSISEEKIFQDDQFILHMEHEHRIYQYLLKQYVFKTKKGSYLFAIEGDYHWTYNFAYSLEEPLYLKDSQVIRYTIKCKSGLDESFIKNCIYYLSFNTSNINTIYFDTASFVIIIPKSEYNQCSTAINELINIRAKEVNLFPISISEIIEYS